MRLLKGASGLGKAEPFLILSKRRDDERSEEMREKSHGHRVTTARALKEKSHGIPTSVINKETMNKKEV